MDDTELVTRTREMLRNGKAQDLRRRAGLSLREAARASGVAHCTIYCWENRRSRGRPALLARYSRFLLRLAKIEEAHHG